jgi:hypothetical protein
MSILKISLRCPVFTYSPKDILKKQFELLNPFMLKNTIEKKLKKITRLR